ncbi:MAG: hypothetical protein AB7F96_07260 [Beijerinckiaceae bacterium]
MVTMTLDEYPSFPKEIEISDAVFAARINNSLGDHWDIHTLGRMRDLAKEGLDSALDAYVEQVSYLRINPPKGMLTKYRDDLRRIVTFLDQSPERRDYLDQQLLLKIAELSVHRANGVSPSTIVEEYIRLRDPLAAFLNDVEHALTIWRAHTKGGRPASKGFKLVVKTALEIAEIAKIALRVRDDKAENRADTPFVRLVFEVLESFLPDEFKSASFAACATAISRNEDYKAARKRS